MAVTIPSSYGLILRRNERTRPFIEGRGAEYLAPGWPPNEDEHLVAYTVAMNSMDIADEVARLEALGCIEGTDFVVTGSVRGILFEPAPVWLREERGHEWTFHFVSGLK